MVSLCFSTDEHSATQQNLMYLRRVRWTEFIIEIGMKNVIVITIVSVGKGMAPGT